MAATFKLFPPNGYCRRVTFPSAPDLSAINEVVDEMVDTPAERRYLTYIDSEGDDVVIKTSRDVAEAVRDAREAGARAAPGSGGVRSIRVHIRVPRGTPSCGRARYVRATTGPSCGGRSRRGLFAHPAQLPSELREVAHVLSAFFPGVLVCSPDDDDAPAVAKGDTEERAEAKKTEQATGERGEVAEARSDDAAAETPSSPPPRPADSAVVEALGTTVTPREPAPAAKEATRDSQQPSASASAMSAKAALLRDMGFEIPLDVARNMVAEMGGRMDLIVRALVANSK